MENPTKPKNKVYIKRLGLNPGNETVRDAICAIWEKLYCQHLIPSRDKLVALKLSFKERSSMSHIDASWISSLILSLKNKSDNLFLVENNFLGPQNKYNAVETLNLLDVNGYNMQTLGIPVIIGDGIIGQENSSIQIKGEHFDNVNIARAIAEASALVSISYLSKYNDIGVSGSIKSLGWDSASIAGKLKQCSSSMPDVVIEKCTACGACLKVCPVNALGLKHKKAILVKERCIACEECTIVCRENALLTKLDESIVKSQEKMVEYALGVKNALRSRLICFNILPNKSCVAGSLDPVSIDKACLDIIGENAVNETFGDIDVLLQIKYGEKIKLGSSAYEPVEI